MRIAKLLIVWCFIGVVSLMLLSGCGSSSDSTTGGDNTVTVISSPSGSYAVTYVPGSSAASEGKTTFQIKVVQRSDNSSVTGQANSIILTPMMDMGMMGSHSAPVDIIKESGTAGIYDCTIYYLMSGPWQLDVKIGAETATFSPSVASATSGSDTTKKSMYGTSDIVSGGTSTWFKYYFLFSDGMVSHATPTFKLYISHTIDMKMTFNPISMVSSPTGTVASAIISASTDSTFATGTVLASDDGDGHWSVSGISELLSAGTHTVYVKLQVDTEDKAVFGTIPYAEFKVTSH